MEGSRVSRFALGGKNGSGFDATHGPRRRYRGAPALLRPVPPGPPVLPAAPGQKHRLRRTGPVLQQQCLRHTLPPRPSGSRRDAFPCSAAPSCSRRGESTSRRQRHGGGTSRTRRTGLRLQPEAQQPTGERFWLGMESYSL